MRRIWLSSAGIAAAIFGLWLASPALADPPTKSQINSSQNNLKQIVLAFHNYASAYPNMPNNVYHNSGKPMLSWRVLILPFVEEDKLYKEFKLDEPWDSENNKKLIARMPKIYAPIRVKAKEGETFYQGFVGKKAVFGPGKVIKLPQSFPDGTSNTALVFEAGEPTIWTKPDELVYDEDKPLPKLGGMFDGEFNVALADGSVMRCKKDADEGELRKLIMPNDGQPIDMKKIRK
ncbi:MAG TPA: DUF1559 domain-containing protein [Gemmataceae bacterium]|jgi:hypothetical protein|nr:DUF1559 domain-containing protein [Gemmataceae bacterium]